jgi:hypothetical protein
LSEIEHELSGERLEFEHNWLLESFPFDDHHATYAPLSERKHEIH